MPEEQAPFVHQQPEPRPDGSTTPRRGAPSLRLLSTLSLDRQVRAVKGIEIQQEPAGIAITFPIDEDGIARAIETLQLLRDPTINAVVATMAALPIGDSVILADVATALLGAGTRRPRLILALRSALEDAS